MTDVSPALQAACNLIAYFEQFQGTAKWDVNAYRLGFGSDTEGPEQRKVVRGMTTTRERALVNLEKRVPQFMSVVEGQIGTDLFSKLGANTIAALTSLAYNYGRVPTNVVNALQKDSEAVSAAIRDLQGDNRGVNAWRRNGEAAAVALDGGQY